MSSRDDVTLMYVTKSQLRHRAAHTCKTDGSTSDKNITNNSVIGILKK